jgi:hypothetical protein
MTIPDPPLSSDLPVAPEPHVPQRRIDRFLPRLLHRASVGRFYGPGGMAAAPDSPAQHAAEARAMEAGTKAKKRPHPPQ